MISKIFHNIFTYTFFFIFSFKFTVGPCIRRASSDGLSAYGSHHGRHRAAGCVWWQLRQRCKLKLRWRGRQCWWPRLFSSSSWGCLARQPCTSCSCSIAGAARCSTERSRGLFPSAPHRGSRTSRSCTCTRKTLVACSIPTTISKIGGAN